MIGNFIKKIWKDWPEHEMTIKAADLNKWENSLEEHDKRLYQLKAIENQIKTQIESNTNQLKSDVINPIAEKVIDIDRNVTDIDGKVADIDIKIIELNNKAYASEYANNSVIIEEEAKEIGTIGAYKIYQLGYCEMLINAAADGYKTIYPFEATDVVEYYLVDVAASVSDSSNGKVASANCSCTEPEVTKAEVSIIYNSEANCFTVKWNGFKDNKTKLLTFRIQFITQTA